MEAMREKAKEAAAAARKQLQGECPENNSPTGGSSAPSGPVSSRRMKFPYTFTAKIVQFPWKYYYNHSWVYKYYFFACILSFPVFVKIHNVFNSPANVAKWKEIKRKEKEAEEHH